MCSAGDSCRIPKASKIRFMDQPVPSRAWESTDAVRHCEESA